MSSNLKKVFILSSLLILSSCGGGGGGGSAVQALAAIINSFTASVSSVVVGGTADISWTSSNTTECQAGGSWTGTKGTNGTETVTISAVGVNRFTLTCKGEGANAVSNTQIEGYRNIKGIAVDGYISGATIFIDKDVDGLLDSDEDFTTSDNLGAFTIKYSNGALVSLGGQDVDTQTQLDNYQITRDLSGHSSNTFMVTPVTSVAHFMPSQSIYNTLGLDSSIDIFTADPVANKGDGAGYDLLYEKGNQLTVLAYALQNMANNLKTTTDSTADYFKAISEEINIEHTATSALVNIEKKAFIEKVLDNLVAAKSLTISSDNKANAITALSSVLPIIGVKSTDALTSSVIRFSTNTFQTDFVSIANGTAELALVNSYTSDVLNYIATDQNINASDIQPSILAFADSISLQEDATVSFSPLINDSLTTGSAFIITTSSPLNGSVSISGETITYTPTANFNGQDSFNYTVTQGSISASSTISITVAAVNDAPSLNIASTINYNENDTIPIEPSVLDVDGDELTLSISGTDADSFTLTNNLISFNSSPDFETKNSYVITLTLTDGVLSVEKTITININDINEDVGYKVPTSIDVIETKD